MGYFYLFLAIVFEIVGTTAMKPAEGFTKMGPSAVVIIGYAASFFFFSMVVKSISVGVAYAIWAGMGIVLLSLSSFIFLKQTFDLASILGMSLIISGTAVIYLFSKTAAA